MGKRKAESDNPNQDFCDFLIEIAEYEKNVNRNIYKYNAYRKASSALAAHPTKIKSGAEAKKLQGVGEKIADKIDEFIRDGKLRKIDTIRNDDRSQAINTLTRVSGIGPAKAQELVRSGIKSIEDLENNKDKLNHHQLIGLKYLNDFEQKIPRSEIEEIEGVVRKSLATLDGEYQITVCGSYRRGKSESGDIDVLVTHPRFLSKSCNKGFSSSALKDIVETLEKAGLITDSLTHGDVKYMGVCKVGEVARRIDIRLTPCDQYHCAILYFTGSDVFNQKMRAHALQNGYTLNEYTLRPIGATGVPGEPVPVTSEEDIFDYIDYKYVEPKDRG